MTHHKWVGGFRGGSPADIMSCEWVRRCEICGMEDIYENEMPECPSAQQLEREACALIAEEVGDRLPDDVWAIADAIAGRIRARGTKPSARKICTCHSHQFAQCRGKDHLGVGWVCADEQPTTAERAAPDEGQIVFVQGGVAQYRGGVFYTGMEDPRYQRPITWEVKWWRPMDTVRGGGEI